MSMRVVAAILALALAVWPVVIAPVPPMASIAGVSLLVAAAGIVLLWRSIATAAACVFLVDYAAAVWLASEQVDIAGAAGVGLAVLFYLQAIDLARRMRGAAVDTPVVRTHLARWAGFAAATLAAAVLSIGIASALAAPMPPVIAPLLAAAGALGVLAALATIIARAATRPR
jgi:hypothetical protein